MFITCVCVTYKRPRNVGWIIHQFLKQTHPDKRLLILADDGCFAPHEDPDCRWKLIPCAFRYPTLGLKRNASCRMACHCWPETEAICPWDDDDFYLPWHLEAMNAALQNADWSLPSEVLYRQDCCGKYRRHLTGPGKFYHAGQGYHLDALRRANYHNDGFLDPYPLDLSGPEDQALFRRLEAIDASICDPIAITGLPPSYVYGTNDGLMHISSFLKDAKDTGVDAYAMLGQQPCEPAELVIEPPPGVELDNPVILPGVFPRPF